MGLINQQEQAPEGGNNSQAIYDRMVIQSLETLYKGDSAENFVKMAQQSPSDAVAGTTAMLMKAPLMTARQVGVPVDIKFMKPVANAISEELGNLLKVGGVVKDDGQLKQIMAEGAQKFLQLTGEGQ